MIGRFISADSIVPNPNNPQSFNRYSYCLNNPLRYVDPSGHDPDGWTSYHDTWYSTDNGVPGDELHFSDGSYVEWDSEGKATLHESSKPSMPVCKCTAPEREPTEDIVTIPYMEELLGRDPATGAGSCWGSVCGYGMVVNADFCGIGGTLGWAKLWDQFGGELFVTFHGFGGGLLGAQAGLQFVFTNAETVLDIYNAKLACDAGGSILFVGLEANIAEDDTYEAFTITVGPSIGLPFDVHGYAVVTETLVTQLPCESYIDMPGINKVRSWGGPPCDCVCN